MMVNGPLEIYGTVIGLKMFDAMFNILASMGIIFLPLLILFFENITQPFESEIQNGASTSLRRVGIHFFLWVFTVMLFVAPTWKLDVTGVTYKPVCHPSALTSRFGDTGTTYDDAFAHLEYQDIRYPIMMGLVLTAMSGFTNAAITSLPCKTDVQAIQNTLDTTRLSPQVATQVQRFQNECFAPARAKFNSTNPNPSRYQSLMNNYGGQTDLSWIGSHVMQSLYYSNIYPQTPVPGFTSGAYPSPYQSYNAKSGITPSKWGYPTCEQWWSDPDNGLEHQLVALASAHSPSNPHLGTLPFTDQVASWLTYAKRFTHLGSQVTAQDVIARDMLYDVGANSGFGRFYTGYMHIQNTHASTISDVAGYGAGAISGTIAEAGQAMDAVGSAVDRAEISQEIPILQAVLLALALALGPMIIMAGMLTGKGISVIFTYYFLVGSLFFMTFIEKFIHYIEVSLHASQSMSLYALGNGMIMYNIFTKLYFFGPMIYLGLMSIAGVGIGNSLDNAFSSRSHGAGKTKGIGVISKAATFIK